MNAPSTFLVATALMGLPVSEAIGLTNQAKLTKGVLTCEPQDVRKASALVESTKGPKANILFSCYSRQVSEFHKKMKDCNLEWTEITDFFSKWNATSCILDASDKDHKDMQSRVEKVKERAEREQLKTCLSEQSMQTKNLKMAKEVCFRQIEVTPARRPELQDLWEQRVQDLEIKLHGNRDEDVNVNRMRNCKNLGCLPSALKESPLLPANQAQQQKRAASFNPEDSINLSVIGKEQERLYVQEESYKAPQNEEELADLLATIL